MIMDAPLARLPSLPSPPPPAPRAPSYPAFQSALASTQAMSSPLDSEHSPRTLCVEPHDRTMMADIGVRTMIGSFNGALPNAQTFVVNVMVDRPTPVPPSNSSLPPAAQYASMVKAAMHTQAQRRSGLSARGMFSIGMLIVLALGGLVTAYMVLS